MLSTLAASLLFHAVHQRVRNSRNNFEALTGEGYHQSRMPVKRKHPARTAQALQPPPPLPWFLAFPGASRHSFLASHLHVDVPHSHSLVCLLYAAVCPRRGQPLGRIRLAALTAVKARSFATLLRPIRPATPRPLGAQQALHR